MFFQFNLLVLCSLFSVQSPCFMLFVFCSFVFLCFVFYLFKLHGFICYAVSVSCLGGLFLRWNWWVIAGLTHQCHCRWSLWAWSEYIAPFLRVKALGKFRFVLRFSGIFSFCLSLALFRPKALLQGWFLKNLEL